MLTKLQTTAAYVLVLLAAVAAAYGIGYSTARVVTAQAAVKEADKKVEQVQEQYKQDLQTLAATNQNLLTQHNLVVTDYEKKLSEIDRKYRDATAAGRLRLPKATCKPALDGFGEGGATEVADGLTTGEVLLPEHIESNLYNAFQRADEVSEQLRSLQQWIKNTPLSICLSQGS